MTSSILVERVKTMEQPYQRADDVIYFEVADGKGVLHYDGRTAKVHPPTIDMILHGIDALVNPVLNKVREFYVKPKADEETSKVPVLSPDELSYKTLEGMTMRLAGGKVTLGD